MRDLGVRLGDTLPVGLPGHVLRLRVVGTVTLPSFGVEGADHPSLGRGALLTAQDLYHAAALNPRAVQAGSAAATTLPSALAIDVVPGTSPAARAALTQRLIAGRPDPTPGGTYQLDRPLAAEVSNASGMGGQPLALAVGLAVASVLSLELAVLASVRRRRRELALLKTLGMTRRQVRAIVAWQTTVTLVIALGPAAGAGPGAVGLAGVRRVAGGRAGDRGSGAGADGRDPGSAGRREPADRPAGPGRGADCPGGHPAGRLAPARQGCRPAAGRLPAGPAPSDGQSRAPERFWPGSDPAGRSGSAGPVRPAYPSAACGAAPGPPAGAGPMAREPTRGREPRGTPLKGG